MPVGIAQHDALRVGEAEPACREIGLSLCSRDWPRALPCLTAMIRIACRFGRLRRHSRTLWQADLAIFEPEPSPRPPDCLADADAVHGRDQVERVAFVVGAEIAPDAGLRARQMD